MVVGRERCLQETQWTTCTTDFAFVVRTIAATVGQVFWVLHDNHCKILQI